MICLFKASFYKMYFAEALAFGSWVHYVRSIVFFSTDIRHMGRLVVDTA